MIRDVHPEFPDTDPDFLPIPEPGSRGKNEPDPGSGSATLKLRYIIKREYLEQTFSKSRISARPSGARLQIRIRKDLSSYDLLDPDSLALKI
jgi:hypothetical protein